MSHNDKRSVHTDALETLGTIIGSNEHRDAIHLAVEPITADMQLFSGMHIGIKDGRASPKFTPHVGIVDPFIERNVQEGERFWLVVYPRQITSLRHVWTHPAFPPSELETPTQPRPDKAVSEAWLRDFCDHADCPGYDAVMSVLLTGKWGDDDGYSSGSMQYDAIFFSGTDAHGDIPDEFWTHMEIAHGYKGDKPEYFSCSC